MDKRIIRAKLDQIRSRIILRRWPILPWEARTADHLAAGAYRYDGGWESVTGDSLWPAGKTLFLRTRAETPAGVPSQELCIEFSCDEMEGLLSVNGRPYAGIDANHARVVMPAAGPVELEAEFMCLGRVLHQPELQGEKARLRGVAFVQVDRETDAAFYDLSFTWEACQHAADERRRQRLHAALEEALLAVDLTAPPDAFREDLAAARERLQERIGSIAPDPEGGQIYLAGHTHIDVAWLWPLRETVRKCGRSFSTACRLMERYPEYHFSCSQPQLYAYTQEHYPQLYEEIKQWIQTGRWECTGGMWVEADCNVSSGEALIRQVLYGLRFYREEFGARPRTCWLPDVFGYPASLPGILHGCGLETFFTAKLHWQARNAFPKHLFYWEGLDGTRVLAHIPRLPGMYNGRPNPEQLSAAWDGFLQKAVYPELLFPFGFGDGGGGPTDEMLEYAARLKQYPGLPACRQGVAETYFDDVRDADPDLPVWVGELYLETHRGTYTTQSATKKANRKNELLLREAELWGSLANAYGAAIDVGEALRPAWQNLLLLQFHDILPGSSIGEVYREAQDDYARIESIGRSVRDAGQRALAEGVGQEGGVVAFNGLSWSRSDLATATIPDLSVLVGDVLELVQPDGLAFPAQVIGQGDEGAAIVFVPDSVPPLGYAAFSVRRPAAAPEHALRAEGRRIENRYFVLELDEEDGIRRLLDKRTAREVFPAGQSGNQLQLFQDGPEREAAWNVHDTFEKREYAWDPGTTLEVVEQGPVRAIVRITRRYRQSRIEQDVILYDRLPRIDFVTRADWQERQVMLKAAFPLEVRSMHATFEIQFGAVERPTHRNTSWDEEKFEVCGHRWADMSEAGYGVSLLNDCRYGHDVQGNVLRLTLLRGTERPDPDADRGHHAFTYSLLPHTGDWREAETVQRAWELNAPILCLPGRSGQGVLPQSRSFFEIDGPALLETLKPAEDGNDLILRLYEPNGGRGRVVVRSTLPLDRVLACNHVEEKGDEVPWEGGAFSFQISPFEIKTFRLIG